MVDDLWYGRKLIRLGGSSVGNVSASLPNLSFVFSMLLPSAAGGLVSFLLAFRAGHYKNNRYIAKSTVEILGGAVTGSFLSYPFAENAYLPVIAFLIGGAWSQLLQRLRATITRMVEGALSGKGDT